MNAYELAKAQQAYSAPTLEEIIKQQADRIAELSKNVDELEEELLKTPQIKELSDEEIEQVGRENLSYWDSYDEGLMLFARAILKKASEK